MTDFAGEIAVADEIDILSATLTAGLTYFVELEGEATGPGTLVDPFLSVFFGMTLATSNDDGGVGFNSRAIFTPAASGTYDFAVSGLGGGTGTYELHINEDDLRNTIEGDGDAGAVGNRLPGQFATINYEGDVDIYSTLLVAGLSYAFYERGSPTGNGTLPDTFLTLLDAQGNELAFNDDSANTANSFFEYTPEETGFYAVEAGAFSSNTGSYQVIVGAGRGNNVANFIVGTDVSDNVQGLGGNDIINGELGLDRLYGGNGSDNIDGGDGGDLMSGEKGNDRYFSDNANDRMVEFADGGIDTIFASISRGVDANVENLTMLGNQASWAIGNELANVVRGNELTNAIIGGDGDDWIYGGAGDDRITSGPGADHLVGESGFDSFVFTEAFGRDTVHAFERGSDRLILSGLDADTSALGNQAFAFLGGAAFSGTAGELRYDGSSVTGDVNGDGAADFTIVIANNVALTALDLVL